jgi:sugar O-acyltransferase (sialic acid O-acetyltransferase NeuD family)
MEINNTYNFDNNTTLFFYGTGGCARSNIPIAKVYLNLSNIYFVDDYKKENFVNNIKVLKFDELLEFKSKNNIKIIISIANNKLRRKLSKKIEENGFETSQLISKKCYLMDSIKIGKGSILSPFTTIGSNTTIGNFFHCNLYSYVEHDCLIGDYVTFAPGVRCNGNVIIHNDVFIGSGAIILPGSNEKKINIGRGAVIGAGSVVTKDIKPYSTVAGIPAKEI